MLKFRLCLIVHNLMKPVNLILFSVTDFRSNRYFKGVSRSNKMLHYLFFPNHLYFFILALTVPNLII